jgi:DNA-directed RNA polymerase specialized sigma24 family protein
MSNGCHENARELLSYLAALPPLEHHVLHEVYFARGSLREIADRLDVPVTAVSAALGRALRAVAQFLDTGPGDAITA